MIAARAGPSGRHDDDVRTGRAPAGRPVRAAARAGTRRRRRRRSTRATRPAPSAPTGLRRAAGRWSGRSRCAPASARSSARLVLSLVASVVTLLQLATTIVRLDAREARARPATGHRDGARPRAVGARSAIVIGLIFIAVYRRCSSGSPGRAATGRASCSGCSAASASPAGWSAWPSASPLPVPQRAERLPAACSLIAGIVLLALKPSNEWYRFRGWQRATGQG